VLGLDEPALDEAHGIATVAPVCVGPKPNLHEADDPSPDLGDEHDERHRAWRVAGQDRF
jgi:hypothetical protein